MVVSIKDAAGKVVDTVELGALAKGRHGFDWTPQDGKPKGTSFEVTALNGAAAVGVTRLSADRVEAVYSEGGQITVELARFGKVRYSEIKGVS